MQLKHEDIQTRTHKLTNTQAHRHTNTQTTHGRTITETTRGDTITQTHELTDNARTQTHANTNNESTSLCMLAVNLPFIKETNDKLTCLCIVCVIECEPAY